MSKLCRWSILCLLACAALSSRGEIFSWEDGAVVDVGCQGAGDNNHNSDSEIMYFLGNGTIHGTYTPAENNPYSWAIWRNYLITNGIVVVDATDIKARIPNACSPSFQRGMVLGEHGSLVISNASWVSFGLVQPEGYPPVDVPRVSFVNADGTPQAGHVNLGSCTVKGFPRSGVTAGLRDANVLLAIAGPDFPAVFGTTFTNARTYIFDDAFIPEGATLTGGASTTLYLAAYEPNDAADFLQYSKDHRFPWSVYGAFPTCTHDVNVGFKLVLESTCGCSFTKTVAGTAANSTVYLPGGLTHTFAKLAGTVRFDTYSTGSVPTIQVNAAAAGTRLCVNGDRGVMQFASGLVAPAVCSCADGTWYVFPDANGRYDFDGLTILKQTANMVLPVNANFDLASALGTVKTTPAAGTTLSVALDNVHSPAFIGGEGQIRLSGNVCNRAVLWLDPSRADTCYKIGETTPNYLRAKSNNSVDSLTKQNGSYYLIEAMADVRAGQTSWFLRNTRNYDGVQNGSRTGFEDLPSVYPYRVTDGGPNGLAYMSCGAGNGIYRRIQTATGTLDPTSLVPPTKDTLADVKFAVLVFGSQSGGGRAVLGLADSALTRAGMTKDYPIAPAGSSVRAWIDGAAVDPTSTGLSGGWQIISLDITGHNVSALGWAEGNYLYSGGQNYGEVLFFKEVLAEAERVSVERYLAQKWGISAYTPSTTAITSITENPGKAQLYGDSGTVEVTEGHVQVSGRFGGDISVAAGAVLDVSGAYEPAIPTEGLVGWFDPDGEGALRTETEDGESTIYGLFPHGKTEATMSVGDIFFYGVGSRRPFAVKSARGFGPERTWIDFDHPAAHVKSISDGNTLRFKQWTANGIADSTFTGGGSDRQLNVRTVVFVNDSFRGGADPLRQDVSSGGQWGNRGKAAASKAIWSGAGTAVTGGSTRLNGVAVNGTTTGYTGEAEVLSVVTTEAVKLGNFGYYGNSEQCAGSAEMMGESLMYSTALTEAQVKTIEDYLLFKWMGIAPDGVGDFTAATVSGAGTVRARKWSDLPRFDAAFAGTVSVANEAAPTLAMAVDATTAPGTVTGAFRLPSATLTGVSSATINVRVTGDTFGNYPLVELASVASPIAWTVNVTGISPDKVKVAVTREGASVVLKLQMSGTMVIFR